MSTEWTKVLRIAALAILLAACANQGPAAPSAPQAEAVEACYLNGSTNGCDGSSIYEISMAAARYGQYFNAAEQRAAAKPQEQKALHGWLACLDRAIAAFARSPEPATTIVTAAFG